jgi:hypothetical protein
MVKLSLAFLPTKNSEALALAGVDARLHHAGLIDHG